MDEIVPSIHRVSEGVRKPLPPRAPTRTSGSRRACAVTPVDGSPHVSCHLIAGLMPGASALSSMHAAPARAGPSGRSSSAETSRSMTKRHVR